MTTPITFTRRGQTMVPIARQMNMFAAAYDEGETVTLVPVEGRSMKSHNHFFVTLHEMWQSLPEHYGDRFPTDDHLRRYALIKAGYFDQRTIVAASKAEALRLAAFVKPMDEFAVVTVSEATVTVYTAKSQSMKAMGAKVFQASKQSVLDVVAEMVGVPVSSVAA